MMKDNNKNNNKNNSSNSLVFGRWQQTKIPVLDNMELAEHELQEHTHDELAHHGDWFGYWFYVQGPIFRVSLFA